MHRLLLARHAHAETPPGVHDFERPLSERGRSEAGAVAAWLRENEAPGRIVASAAARTVETARAYGAEVETSERLYSGGLEDYLDVIEDADESVQTLLIVGHQPVVGELAEQFDGDGAIEAFPPGALAVIEVPGTWADAFAEGQRVRLLTPADV